MARGRKPKPSNLKVVAGTERADRRNESEPKPEVSRPKPPVHLSKPAKAEWNRVVDQLFNLGIMSDLDVAALAAYCAAYGRWVDAERALARMAEEDPDTRGIMITTVSGNAIQNPLVGAANKAMADMVRFAAEFGMTPSARTRIRTSGDDGKKNPADKYFG
ncbi:phage terminase small subunit P27 family [Maritimibacter sp. DP07]|uniref:Phage terminase small subunit P27 family n=1 Tax=Maritimibacter harenae TaxID=2606218 RepID=A0A845M3U5_9RHOB|nr:phage terminase small subunit P27 family [Maritimibacter harenae]MZR14236.1 phage terminase small subunit P27 family [Maritimibacter harenae]